MPDMRTLNLRLKVELHSRTNGERDLGMLQHLQQDGCAGGTKRGRSRPCASNAAIHSAFLTSVLRPGTYLIWAELTTRTVSAPSTRLETSFQNALVRSMAT